MVVLLIIALTKIRVLYNYFSTLEQMKDMIVELEMKTIAKCILATMQILGNLATKLKVSFPFNYKNFLSTFVAFFKFDITMIVMRQYRYYVIILQIWYHSE